MAGAAVRRVIVHFDCDAFYAQCEEVRDPTLRTRPLGVTQKYLIVTSNYPARAKGVSKLMSIKEAVQTCPELVLINGEDLTPYRKASKQVLAVLQRFGTAEKLGMDEVLLDVTEEVDARLSRGTIPMHWAGHVHNSKLGVVQENRHRVMDLRANTGTDHMSSGFPEDQSRHGMDDVWAARLMIGSQIAAEARAAIKAETGFRSSAGISSNRMLAKLSSGLHKPDDQTVLPPCQAANFVAPLPLRAIPGVGYKLGLELKDMGLQKVEDLRMQERQTLTAKFGERTANFLLQACFGEDPTPVKPKQPAKAVTVEDSFKSCTSIQAARHVLQILVPDLLARLKEEFEDEGRKPKSFTLKWRLKGNGWSRNSASCPLPASIQVEKGAEASQCETLLKSAVALFSRNVQTPFHITLFNLGACNFVERQSSGSIASALTRFLVAPAAAETAPQNHASATNLSGAKAADRLTMKRRDYGANPSGQAISKTQERLLREQGMLQADLNVCTAKPGSLGGVTVAAKKQKQNPFLSTAGPLPPSQIRLDLQRQGLGRKENETGMNGLCPPAVGATVPTHPDVVLVPVSKQTQPLCAEHPCVREESPRAEPPATSPSQARQERVSMPQIPARPAPVPDNAFQAEAAVQSQPLVGTDHMQPQFLSTGKLAPAAQNCHRCEPQWNGSDTAADMHCTSDQLRKKEQLSRTDELKQAGSGRAVTEIQRLRDLLSQPGHVPSDDLDIALAQQLQAEELRIVQRRNPKAEKRKVATLDSFFSRPASKGRKL